MIRRAPKLLRKIYSQFHKRIPGQALKTIQNKRRRGHTIGKFHLIKWVNSTNFLKIYQAYISFARGAFTGLPFWRAHQRK
jgi:hypothetical protein